METKGLTMMFFSMRKRPVERLLTFSPECKQVRNDEGADVDQHAETRGLREGRCEIDLFERLSD